MRKNKIKQFIHRLTIKILCLLSVLFLLNCLIEYLKTVDIYATKNVVLSISNSDTANASMAPAVDSGEKELTVGEGEIPPSENLTDAQKIIRDNSGSIDWKILYGMFMKETQGDCNRIGDLDFTHPSIGCYQINRRWTPETEVSDECAKDLACSTRWTVKRLIKYEKITGSIDGAIMSHNGTPNTDKTLNYLSDVKNIITSI